MVASEWAIVKASIATASAVGAFFSLSRQNEPMTVKSLALFGGVGGVVAFYSTIIFILRLNLPMETESDWEMIAAIAGIFSFFMSIVSMSLALFIYNMGVLLKENPLKFLELISKLFGRISLLFKGDKDA